MPHSIFKMSFAKIYGLYLDKITRKGRSKEELDVLIIWLTGHSKDSLQAQLDAQATVEEFFDAFPAINENAKLITGSICGIRVEDVADPLMKRIRYLDKLVDELAKGKAIEKILRK